MCECLGCGHPPLGCTCDEAEKRELPVDNIIVWPYLGEKVIGRITGRQGIVKETKIKDGYEMALIRWIHTIDGYEDWIPVENLKRAT